ncbi:MAG: helix-turn-helix domain-containing protein [Carbonactinosporaceae bacterium]
MGDSAAVAKVVNERMQERGVTQRDLAERSGVSVATLRKIQHGVPQSRNRSTLTNISRALGFAEDHLWRVWGGGGGVDEEASAAASDVAELRSELADLAGRVAAIETHLGR